MAGRTRQFTGTTSPEVTSRELEHSALAREAAGEGIVLLKNEGLLPLNPGIKLGLYGMGAVKTIKGGTGSGDVNERHSVTIREGLESAGFEITSAAWLDTCDDAYSAARLAWKETILADLPRVNNDFFVAYSTHQFRIPAGEPVDEATASADGANVGIYVLSRVAGEGRDRTVTEGDFLISAEERAQLAAVSAAYEDVVLVINAGGIIDLSFADDFPNIRAIVYFLQAGQEGGHALADLLTASVTPSGKLTDTWALSYSDYPNASTFSFMSGDITREEYREGIYVGYRYFDTFDVPVRYSFGFGLSYTDFSPGNATGLRFESLGTPSAALALTVPVTNTGSRFPGKEIVEIYAACPQEGLPKEFRRLAGFGKTKLLYPGETEELAIRFPLYNLASYDEAKAAWVLEAGEYGLFAGNSLASAEVIGSFTLDETKILYQCRNICVRKEELEEMLPDEAVKTKLAARTAAWKAMVKDAGLPVLSLSASDLVTETVDYDKLPERSDSAREIVGKLSTEQMIALATGELRGAREAAGNDCPYVPGAAAETTVFAEKLGVDSIVLADGPAGVRLKQTYRVLDGKIDLGNPLAALEHGIFDESGEKEEKGDLYYQFCTAFPVGTELAQTWNTELVRRVGESIGREMSLFRVTLWLAPGMNIHRNPLCGRNFEYYSEDPLLTGSMAAAVTLGVQSNPGCGTTIKHFAGNNQEDNRMGSDDIMSERVFREIYLKGFELAVKKAQPLSIMTSYNMINGVHAANSYDLCTAAARREWGFRGAIMTDWTTTTNSTGGVCTASGCLRAGNDMIMPGDPADHENIRSELAEGTLSLADLKACVLATVDLILGKG